VLKFEFVCYLVYDRNFEVDCVKSNYQSMAVRVWTDGCCLNNNRRGVNRTAGFGFCFEKRSRLGSFYGPVQLEGRNPPTNNTAEWQAVINAIIVAKKYGHTRLQVYTDSNYICEAWNEFLPVWRQNGWRKFNGSPLANATWIKQLDRVRRGLNVTIKWIPREQNNKADALANLATEIYLQENTWDGSEMFNLLCDGPDTSGIFTWRKVAVFGKANIPAFVGSNLEGSRFCLSSCNAHGMVKVPTCRTRVSGDEPFWIPVENEGFHFRQNQNVGLYRGEPLRLLLPRGVKIGEALEWGHPYDHCSLDFEDVDEDDYCDSDYDDDDIEFY